MRLRLKVSWLRKIIVLALMASPLLAHAQMAARDMVITEAGKLRGITHQGVTTFRGIPFAAPPTDDNRWRAPQPVAPWPGIRRADHFGPDCMQKPMPSDAAPLGATPAEDCLYLNVWTPSDAIPDPNAHVSGNAKPVMVWIHGGGYVNGGSSSAIYDGTAFARDDVILVSFNYRLGRFGFFAHPALSAEAQSGYKDARYLDRTLGNYGVMDQLAALAWVKRNIAVFGGDPNNVTLFGESAGGSSVLDLTGSPAARGLFQRVAVMSGGGRALMGQPAELNKDQPGHPSAETIGQHFARMHGIEGSSPDALGQLRQLPAEEIVDDLNMGTLMGPREGMPTYTGGPIRDGELISGVPETIYKAGLQQQVPMLIGTTDADLGFSSADSMAALFAPFGEDAERARHLYNPEKSKNVQAVGMRLGMDRMMTEPARFIADQVAASGQPVWRYRFSHVAEPMRDQWPGAIHASELPYLFRTLDVRYGHVSDADRAAAWQLHRYFVNFARTGNPNGKGAPVWPVHTSLSAFIMDFTPFNGPVARQDPWQARLDLVKQHLTPVMD